MIKRVYTTKIELKGTQAYDEIHSFLYDISSRIEYAGGFNILYSFNRSKEPVAKLNSKDNRLELKSKVKKWIVDTINQINDSGRI